MKDNGAHLRREEVRRLVTGLCCIFAIIMTLMVSMCIIAIFVKCFEFHNYILLLKKLTRYALLLSHSNVLSVR